MQKPGTHIYNYVIPFIFLATAGISNLTEAFKTFRILIIFPIAVLTGFLFYQSYVLFVDHTPEYPWFEKEVFSYKNFGLVAPQYYDKEILTFGFPHFRNWKKVNEIVSQDTDNCTYITNEGKEISQIYMDNRYGIITSSRKCYYVVYIKRPFITRGNNFSFAEARKDRRVYEYIQDDKKLTDLFKIVKSQ